MNNQCTSKLETLHNITRVYIQTKQRQYYCVIYLRLHNLIHVSTILFPFDISMITSRNFIYSPNVCMSRYDYSWWLQLIYTMWTLSKSRYICLAHLVLMPLNLIIKHLHLPSIQRHSTFWKASIPTWHTSALPLSKALSFLQLKRYEPFGLQCLSSWWRGSFPVLRCSVGIYGNNGDYKR